MPLALPCLYAKVWLSFNFNTLGVFFYTSVIGFVWGEIINIKVQGRLSHSYWILEKYSGRGPFSRLLKRQKWTTDRYREAHLENRADNIGFDGYRKETDENLGSLAVLVAKEASMNDLKQSTQVDATEEVPESAATHSSGSLVSVWTLLRGHKSAGFHLLGSLFFSFSLFLSSLVRTRDIFAEKISKKENTQVSLWR